jgi:hypothetical protein
VEGERTRFPAVRSIEFLTSPGFFSRETRAKGGILEISVRMSAPLPQP